VAVDGLGANTADQADVVVWTGDSQVWTRVAVAEVVPEPEVDDGHRPLQHPGWSSRESFPGLFSRIPYPYAGLVTGMEPHPGPGRGSVRTE